jgi:hypothetical protein
METQMTYNQYDKNLQNLQRDITEVDINTPSLRISSLRYADVLFDENDLAPNYIGLAASPIETSSEGWVIYKFTYSGSNVTRIQKVKGVWDDRVSLF